MGKWYEICFDSFSFSGIKNEKGVKRGKERIFSNQSRFEIHCKHEERSQT